MSEYNLTLGQAMQRAIDDGVTIQSVIGVPVKVVGGNLVNLEDGVVSGPFEWYGHKFKVVEKKRRIMTMREILNKYPDATFEDGGTLDFDNHRKIQVEDFKYLGGEYTNVWDKELIAEED